MTEFRVQVVNTCDFARVPGNQELRTSGPVEMQVAQTHQIARRALSLSHSLGIWLQRSCFV